MWGHGLEGVFPNRAAAVLGYWDELSRIAGRVQAVTETRAVLPLHRLYQLGRLPQLALRRPLLLPGLLAMDRKSTNRLFCRMFRKGYPL
ncbi:hypothetical protein [Paenibacillus nasutitermitis]|uniref:hypothetical protein n=1 Tax=Paenibacillus nasutitermitis TaxID=1652958 RepID=UPI0016661361|nr:hypothetical protein [Paenibacillus nasutitermitis]